MATMIYVSMTTMTVTMIYPGYQIRGLPVDKKINSLINI
jgi:hypothetical protein